MRSLFSERTRWDQRPNRLAEALAARRASGRPLFDLTVSNPTELGFDYPEKEILAAISDPRSLRYAPEPRGLLAARRAVCDYYLEKGLAVDPSHVFLTASTSESYSLVFRLLCDPGDAVLVPRPSYPLFDDLARINDVRLRHYELRYDGGKWRLEINRESAKGAKAVAVVNPHNPTGAFLKKEEHEAMVAAAVEHGLALIADEVFLDYPFGEDGRRLGSTAGEGRAPTFTLSGLSKLAGLPQMKLGWIVVSGPEPPAAEATVRLEILCDTYLSVNSPAQVALPQWMKAAGRLRAAFLSRAKSNYQTLCEAARRSPCSVPGVEGGWYATVRVPGSESDEEWALKLLERSGVYVYPGYFFDFAGHEYLVVSLLADERVFAPSIRSMIALIEQG